MPQEDAPDPSHAAFDCFVQAQTCKDVLQSFSALCRLLDVDPQDHRCFYPKLKERLNYWKAKALWAKLDKRAAHPDYGQGQACVGNKCLVLGAGPCGLRTSIELALLGAKVVLLEKRETFSRNNVLHLWPYTIHDLRGLAAKKFYGRFCSGSLDHISIRQLQLILLKVVLLLGVEVHIGVEYKGLVEPQSNGKEITGWRAQLSPVDHPAGSFQFDVLISAGGGRFVPAGFRRKELRGKLAIGITANFINHHTATEAQVAEISGVARIYNQKFFQDLHTETGIDLENIVYYKDDTHYFVMTAKKKSLLNTGVLKQDHSNAETLLSPANVDQEALLRYAHDAAHFSTGRRLPHLEFACDHTGRPDVAVFDFTCMYRAENASMVRERRGKKLLVGLVGDCLVEPFWPLGTGVARGFLAAFDAAWMVRRWGLGANPVDVLAERESVYQLLSQTTPENTSKNYNAYSINPTTRYPNINLGSIKASQVRNLYDTEDHIDACRSSFKRMNKAPHLRQDSFGRYEDLLSWCQNQTAGYKGVAVTDLTESWRSGLALCALIHHFRPKLIDFDSLDKHNSAHNNQLAFDVAEKELGISPIMSGGDMLAQGQPDRLSMVLYLTQLYNSFMGTAPPTDPEETPAPKKTLSLPGSQSVAFFLSKLKHNSLQRRKEKLSAERERRESKEQEMGEEKEQSLAPPQLPPTSPQGSSELCYFCGHRVYVLERVSTEGKFFHRSCFTCHQCGTTLRLGGYFFNHASGKFLCVQHSEESSFEKEEEKHVQDVGEDSTTAPQGLSGRNGERRLFQPPSGLPDKDHTSASPGPTEIKMLKDQEDNLLAGSPLAQGADPSVCSHRDSEVKPNAVVNTLEEASGEDDASISSPSEMRAEAPHETPPVLAPRSIYLPIRVQVDAEDEPGAAVMLPPVPKPRNILPKIPSVSVQLTPEHVDEDREGVEQLSTEEEPCQEVASDHRPKQPLRKLQLTEEERNQLGSLSFSHDSDSEAPAPSSSSTTARPPKPPRSLLEPGAPAETGAWGSTLTGSIRDQKNRRSFRRKEELAAKAQAQAPHNPKTRSKFSPWNLSSPRLARDHRLCVAGAHVQKSGAASQADVTSSDVDNEEDDDDDDDEVENMLCVDDGVDLFNEKFQMVPSDPDEAQKLELLKMRTLERRAKLCEMQRFHKAQSIQRRLEEIEVTFKELEEKGVVLERALRGEAGSDGSSDLIDQWIQLVHQKNALVSEESDLMVASRQLELEDKQSTLEAELRRYIEMDESEKTPQQREEEERVLQEMLDVVDMRNSLVAFLEERRLKEINEQLHGVSIMEPKRPCPGGAQVHWA
ncbi:F-actin-monooxygenase mical1 [Scleropages formosus]|uniref:Molecule interacting with CasL protein 1 n=1 Tax=Scleropages formosus TaxID=113540 RepID=A0A8C9RTC3_SCLFO|nr:F-actin-monooxygenase mical1-like [Scleropages formosus]XP_018589450.2 F-actin-monooxygenase mical1-like [Scleropages formosus]XP_018589451.2 F-actin-monooxygenase mical1-like [Scleropages formosus]